MVNPPTHLSLPSGADDCAVGAGFDLDGAAFDDGNHLYLTDVGYEKTLVAQDPFDHSESGLDGEIAAAGRVIC